MPLPQPSADRTCLVTGASSGIGAEIARELARRGHGVTLVARREAPLRELADELAHAHGIRAEVITADLSTEAPGDRLAKEVAERGLAVDVLVNNAGLSTMGPVHRGDAATDAAMVRTNVDAVVHLCCTFLPGMVERGVGAVLNVASIVSFQPLPGQAAYAASKAFVLSYSQAASAELRGTGVTMTVLCPGPVATEFNAVMGMSDAEAGGALPKVMWVPAAKVARQAVKGLAAGRGVVIPGAPNRMAVWGSHLAPRRIVVPILARQHPSLRR